MTAHRSGGSSQRNYSMIESLEMRCLLSLPPVAVLTVDGPTPAAIRVAPRVAAATPVIPSLVGRFTGSVKVKKYFISKSFDVELIVTSQKGKTLTGTVTVEHMGSKIPFTGTVNARRQMVISFKKGSYHGTLKGDVSADRRLIVGDATAEGPIDLDGDMKLYKVHK